MKSSQLLKALKHHRETRDIFLGVFPSDKLPPSMQYTKPAVALIANTDPSYKPGQHWCAFYITPDCVYYFDSYGIPPPKSFQRLMQCRKEKQIFGRRLQGRGMVCGHYCLYFILAMVRGGTDTMFGLFGDDLNANDRIVRHKVMKDFNV